MHADASACPAPLSNAVWQGDCRALFAALPDNSVDLILSDPPYKDYQSNRPVAREKVLRISVETFDLELFIRESERVLKPGCHFYCWCDHLSFPAIFEEVKRRTAGLSRREAAGRLKYKNCLIWVKNNHGSGDLSGNYAPQHELVLYASKGRTRPLRGKRPSNVFFERDDQGRISFYAKVSNYRFQHGTSKPPAILERMIEASSERGELVLDPYGGSLSTAEAAMRTGRRYLMGELEAEHCRRGLERLREVREELLADGYDPALLQGPAYHADPAAETETLPGPEPPEPAGERQGGDAGAPRSLPDLLRA
jgi:site-specific DNA-methyltransferase (adenine-specific)